MDHCIVKWLASLTSLWIRGLVVKWLSLKSNDPEFDPP